MRTLTYQLRDLKKFMICIGFEDENNRTQVRIDCGEVFAEYPNAAVTMKVQAPKGGIYPATVTREDNVILWTVRDCDVANKGSGEFQLTFTDGTTVVKTCVGKFHVDRSLKGSGTAPSGVQDWLDHAEDVLEQVESAEIHQPMIGLDGYWYKWDQEAGEYVSTGTKAQGQDGQPGTDATPDLIAKDYADLSFPVAKDSFCYHDGKLYQAKQTIQTAEDWTAAHWQETTVEEKITDIKNAVNDTRSNIGAAFDIFSQSEINKNLFNYASANIGYGTYNTNGELYVSSDFTSSDFISVKSGKKYSCFQFANNSISRIFVNRVVTYSKTGSFISNLGSISGNNPIITIPNDGTEYVRFMYNKNTYNNPQAIMFCEVADETVPSKFYTYGQTDFKVSEFAKASYVEGNISRIDENIRDITDVFDVSLKTMTGTLETGKFIESNGTIADISSYQLLKVAVEPFVDYWITARAYYGKYYFIFHDASGNLLDGGIKATEAGTTTITDVKIIAPENAAFVYVTSPINDNVQAVKEFDHYEIPSASKRWTGKKWAVVGDSITQVNEATTKHYYEYIADETGISVSNMGVGGTGYCRGYDSSRAFYQRISSVPTDADVVTIFGSGNDMNIEAMSKFDGMTWAQALGTYTDATTDTICGCVNVTLDAYFAVMVTAPIGIIAPSPWKSYPTTKLTNNRFEDYTNALKQIAAYRGVPFLDLYHHSNLRPENEANCNACFYNAASLDGNGDGVHPNELGHKIIAPKIYEFVKTLLLG